jgi:glycerophosphoryl diester phosphodiesterase
MRYAPWGPWAAACIQVPARWRRVRIVDEPFLERCHRRGLQVHVWTVDDADEMRRLLDLGVDGLMTDRPTLLRQVLSERDAWFSAE